MNSDLTKNYLILMSAVSFFSSGFRFVATHTKQRNGVPNLY